MVDDPDRLGDAREDGVTLAQRLLGWRCAVMSMKVMTTPRPVGRSIGTDVKDTGNGVPSRRMNQSSSLCTGSPERLGSRTVQSSAGYGDPSRCL
jgi:hypothetical protein